MTSSTWVGSPNGNGTKCLRRSDRSPRCNSTTAAFVGGSRADVRRRSQAARARLQFDVHAAGHPVLRYGDELGMGDDLSLPERDCARTPMQWSNEPHGGFTKSDKPYLPVISGGPYGFEHINAAIQRRHPESLLNWTERIIRMR